MVEKNSMPLNGPAAKVQGLHGRVPHPDIVPGWVVVLPGGLKIAGWNTDVDMETPANPMSPLKGPLKGI